MSTPVKPIATSDELNYALDALVEAITSEEVLIGGAESILFYWDRESGRAHWEA